MKNESGPMEWGDGSIEGDPRFKEAVDRLVADLGRQDRLAYLGGPRDGEIAVLDRAPPNSVSADGGKYMLTWLRPTRPGSAPVYGYVWVASGPGAGEASNFDPAIACAAFEAALDEDRCAKVVRFMFSMVYREDWPKPPGAADGRSDN